MDGHSQSLLLTLYITAIEMMSLIINSALVGAAGSCTSLLCPGNKQVVATCSVNDSTGSSFSSWSGSNTVDCPGSFLGLVHARGVGEMESCNNITARIVSVEGNVFTSQLSLIPTSSNDGERIICAFSGDVIQECILNVPSVNVMGVIEQSGLSEVFVSVTLIDESGSNCVDEYFFVFNGSRVNSNNPRVGPFSVNICTTPEISGLIVGTSRNEVDGPTSTVGVTANTTNLYSNLAVSHSYNVSGVTLDLSWTVVDETVMSESEVMMSCSCESCSSSCVDSSEMSDSATSHRLQLSYNEFSPGRVIVSVSFQSGSCRDVETRVYEVTNFGTAIVSSDKESVIFSFDESLLASGVNVARIRGSCEDGSQEMFWDYRPLTSIALNATRNSNCPNNSHIFQALTNGNMAVGFPIPLEFTSPTTTVTFSEPQGSSSAVIIISVFFVLVSGALSAVILGMGCVISHYRKKTAPPRQEAVYEDVVDPSPSTAHCKPDPRTEENVAYGQVQL